MWQYIRRNTVSIFRIYSMYEPLRVFMTLAAARSASSRSSSGRASCRFVEGDGAGHIQSLILGAVLFNAAVVLAALGVIGDLLCGQRIMLQRTSSACAGSSSQLGVAAVALRARRTPETGQPADDRRATPAESGHTEEREALKL